MNKNKTVWIDEIGELGRGFGKRTVKVFRGCQFDGLLGCYSYPILRVILYSSIDSISKYHLNVAKTNVVCWEAEI